MELVYFALVGLVAGWLAGILMKSSGGLLFDLILGVLGALVGGWLFGILGIGTGGLVGAIVTATVGAVALLALLRVINRQGNA
jgi:uncharacterized membrane protein YeaQ/YmgE (transglycosylase-associated protein family)